MNTALGLLGLVKGQKSLTVPAGLANAWLLGVILWGALGPAGWSVCVVYLVLG